MLNTTIKPFQTFPMWLKHPDCKPGNALQPLIVQDEQEAQHYLARGYVAPEIDEAAWLDMQYQAYFARHIQAMIMGAAKAQEICMAVQFAHGQIKSDLDVLNQRPNDLDLRLDIIERQLEAVTVAVTSTIKEFDVRLKKMGFAVQKKIKSKPVARPAAKKTIFVVKKRGVTK
jgi:hypothetical protein